MGRRRGGRGGEPPARLDGPLRAAGRRPALSRACRARSTSASPTATGQPVVGARGPALRHPPVRHAPQPDGRARRAAAGAGQLPHARSPRRARARGSSASTRRQRGAPLRSRGPPRRARRTPPSGGRRSGDAPPRVPAARAPPVACAHCGLAVPASLVREGEHGAVLLQRLPAGATRSSASGASTSTTGSSTSSRARSSRRASPAGASRTSTTTALQAEATERGSAPDRRRTRLYLEGVHCAACVWLVEKLPAVLRRRRRGPPELRQRRRGGHLAARADAPVGHRPRARPPGLHAARPPRGAACRRPAASRTAPRWRGSAWRRPAR